MSNRRDSCTPPTAGGQQMKRSQMLKRQASTTSSALSGRAGQQVKKQQMTSIAAAGQQAVTPVSKRRASTTPLESSAIAGQLPKRHQTQAIMKQDKASQLATTVLPEWIAPFGAIIKQFVDFTDTSDAIIIFKNDKKHKVSSYSDALMECRSQMKRLARAKFDADPSYQQRLDNILELRPTDKIRGWINVYDTFTPTLKGTMIAFGRASTEYLIQGWDFSSVFVMSCTPLRFALLENGQVRQKIEFRLSNIPIITAQEKADALQWLHRGLDDRFSCSKAGDATVYTHEGGQEIRLQGGWLPESMRTACKKEWHTSS